MLHDTSNSERPECRKALVCEELARFNIDVAALSKTRLAEDGNITEVGSNCTIFWKEKGTEDLRIHGVGFAIRSQLVGQHNLVPTTSNDRIMTILLLLIQKSFLTLILMHAPTLTSEDEDKTAFYDQLVRTILNVPNSVKFVVLGDFNERVGRNHHLWKGTKRYGSYICEKQ